jgi:ribosomal protein L11 methylase PrmA
MPTRDSGSFRDPSGHVFEDNGRVYRVVLPPAAEDFSFVESSGLIERLVGQHLLVEQHFVDPSELGPLAEGATHVLEHPKLPFISYPYEWSFTALKAAALLHIRIHLEALQAGCNLSDASAYNVQFQGTRPVFIDRLSFRRYREGEFWIGHRQFCEQFLNPLLLRALLGVPHNAWYRGRQEGIPAAELATMLCWRHKLSLRILLHVLSQQRLQRKGAHRRAKRVLKRQLPKEAFISMLRGMAKWIEGLNPILAGEAVWDNYSQQNSYSTGEREAKHRFITQFTVEVRPRILWDMGCNDGEFSRVALRAGAGTVVGFEADDRVLEQAFVRADKDKLEFLPLCMDLANPSPSQGWAERERGGLHARGPADGMLALALIHHLAIGRNVPLGQVVEWLVSLAPSGVIEWVPKSDPMVKELLSLREDIFGDYTEEQFFANLERHAGVVKTLSLAKDGRLLVWYQREETTTLENRLP